MLQHIDPVLTYDHGGKFCHSKDLTSNGYYPNASKTYLVVKEESHQCTTQAFANTSVIITTEGKQHLDVSKYWFKFIH